ncbi:hypothetical protein GCM10025331_31210 [Actinoplanes utahensis]|nr:hypothetical protein Aut01nite_32920 [Actinoplanes utahensis]
MGEAERVGPVVRLDHVVAPEAEQHAHDVPVGGDVVDDHHCRHGIGSLRRVGGCYVRIKAKADKGRMYVDAESDSD